MLGNGYNSIIELRKHKETMRLDEGRVKTGYNVSGRDWGKFEGKPSNLHFLSHIEDVG